MEVETCVLCFLFSSLFFFCLLVLRLPVVSVNERQLKANQGEYCVFFGSLSVLSLALALKWRESYRS